MPQQKTPLSEDEVSSRLAGKGNKRMKKNAVDSRAQRALIAKTTALREAKLMTGTPARMERIQGNGVPPIDAVEIKEGTRS